MPRTAQVPVPRPQAHRGDVARPLMTAPDASEVAMHRAAPRTYPAWTGCKFRRCPQPGRPSGRSHVSHEATRIELDALQGVQEEFSLARIHALEQELAAVRRGVVPAAPGASLGVLTAAIAHELNQPLSGILTNASTCLRILAGIAPNLERAGETARRTIRDCNRASEVITRLRRLFSKCDVSCEAVDLGDAAREVIELASFELRRNNVAVRLELDHELPKVDGDPVQLQQVILNLVLNACEAMREVHDRPRRLAVRTERSTDGHVRLSVKDSGIGFDPKTVEGLFQPFYTSK